MRQCLALLLFACGAAAAQPTTDCPKADAVTPAHLVGFWQAEIEGRRAGTLLIEKHPEYAGSLSGAINRGGARSQVAGDIEDGELTLEESDDGVAISATWLGDVVEGSCGREIRGTWQPEGGRRAVAFVLRKQ